MSTCSSYIQNVPKITFFPEIYSTSLVITSWSDTSLPFPPLGLLLLSLKAVMISSRGIACGKLHHELSTVAALVDSSEREWRILENVRPPRENARSTSVDVARSIMRENRWRSKRRDIIPGADKKFKDIS